MERIITKAENEKFYINDIALKVDPLDISIYKEGLSYSWKTLRTKASSKIINGNSIFHLKFNVVFTKFMFLDLHRLVCQTRNSPFVQIENEFVYQSVNPNTENKNGCTFFTLNSLQIVPRSDSPYSVTVELDLRYFNHEVYSGSYLFYKRHFETRTYLKGNKAYSKTFDVDSKENALFEYEIESNSNKNNSTRKTNSSLSISENNIKVYNDTSPVKEARNSFAYVRYSNFLQIKSLRENFGLNFDKFIFDEFNKRDCKKLHEDQNAINHIVNEVYVDNNYYISIIQYKKFFKQKFTGKESKAFKGYITDKIKDIEDYSERIKKISEIKKEFLDLEDTSKLSTELKSLKDKIATVAKNKTLNIYTGRQGVNNVFYTVENVVLNTNNQASPIIDYTIANVSCGFTNLISNIPISGQEFPTHQFLGSTEPLYNVNMVGKRISKNIRGLSAAAKGLEKMRKQLQKNTIDFKMIPDAGFFHVENFFTKLLGSHLVEDFDVYSKANIPKYILRNFNVNTIEGAPGSQAIQFSFYESARFKEEELKPVFRLGESNSAVKKVDNFLKYNFIKNKYSKSAASPEYKAFKWSSKYFTADDFYANYEDRGRGKRNEFKDSIDKRAYNFCLNILDKVQEKVKSRIKIFSSIDHPETKIRETASRHYSGGAVDISVNGLSPLDLMQLVENIFGDKKIGVIAYFTSKEEMENNSRKMNGVGERNFFLHIDDRTDVTRSGNNISILKSRSNTFYALTIDGTTYKKMNGQLIKSWISTLNLESVSGAPGDAEDTSNLDREQEDLIKALPSFRDKIKSTINPFSKDLSDKYNDLDVEIVRVKDLSEDQKTLVEKSFSLNELNPELEIRIFTGDAEQLQEFSSKLKEDNFNFASKESSNTIESVFLPLTSNNFSLSKENKEAKTLVEMFDNLHNLANIMLTEPQMYNDEPDQELERINKELNFKEKVDPKMLGSFSSTLTNVKKGDGSEESSINAVTTLLASFGFGSSVAGLIAGGPVGWLALLGLAGSGGVIGLGLSTASKIDSGAINLIRGFEHLNNYLSAKKITIPSISKSLQVPSFYENMSKSDEILKAFTNLKTTILDSKKELEVFSNSLADVKGKAKVFSLLGSYTDIVNKVNNEDLKLKGLQNEEIYIGELRRIFEYYFGFPYEADSFSNQYSFNDLFIVDGSNKFVAKTGVNLNSSKPGKYQIIGNSNNFPLTKEELKFNQDKKIAYLKLLKDSILEALLENKDISKKVGVTKDNTIFELIGENAYPDIFLPIDPAKSENNLNLHPTFYFYNSQEYNQKRPDYINKSMQQNIKSIVDRSYDFEEALRKGLFTGDRKNLPSKKLNVDNHETLKFSILKDQYESAGGTAIPDNSSGNKTDITPSGTANDLTTSQEIDNRIKDYKDLRKTFDDVFGEVGKKRDPNIRRGEDFKSRQEIIDETISACKGLMIPKKNIKKAFPTYRLYLIEEDSIESDKLSVFDDFYSYSGVKSFTVFSHKNMPASTAVIQIQNISGVLDGTKPEVVRDIDIDQNLTPEEERQAQRAVESIIIRPGINIQLRAGYDSNPNKLKIIFTGRVTEVKNSSAGEMLEVTAQSFGIELISKKLGLNPSDPIRQKKFYNTHSLLGSLMLSEELAHFGRVKKGKRFQSGEAKQLSIDISTGKQEDWFNFSATSWIESVLYDYGIYFIAASIVFPAIRTASSLAITRGSANAFLNFTKGDGLVRLINAVDNVVLNTNTVSTSKNILNYILNGSKALFVGLPSGVFNFTRRILGHSTLAKTTAIAAKAPQIEINYGRFAPFVNTQAARSKAVLEALIDNKILSKVGDISKLSVGEIDKILVNKFGYSFCLANNLLGNAAAVSYWTALNPFTKGLVFGSFPIFRNITGVYLGGVVLGILIDSIIGGIKLGADKGVDFYNYLSGKYNPPSVKILMSPQDDNIFPPPPEEYLVGRSAYSKLQDGLNKRLYNVYKTLSAYSFGISSYALGTSSGLFEEGDVKKIMKNAYLKGDTRLSTSKGENIYEIQNSTIWEILHEMSLRHPGYLYGIRQYGSGLESRVFFGQSNQRFFSKDFSEREIETLNNIDKALVRGIKDTFDNEDFELILGKIPFNEDKSSKTLEIINYWVEKTKERFTPYRKFHNIDSEHDIVSNTLRVDASKVVNQVAVAFKDEDDKETITKIKAVPYLKESMINEKGLNYHNVKGIANASRYGMSELINSAKQMYSGEILIVGNPEINTDDICIIDDNYLNMHGLIEVEAITHMFSHENGFITEIIPNAVAYGKDKYISNIISGSLVFDAHRKLIDKYPRRSEIITYRNNGEASFNADKLEALAKETVVSFYSGSDSGIYNAIYGNVPWVTDYASNDKANNKAVKDIQKQLKESLKNGELIFLSDITNDINLGSEVKDIFNNGINALGVGGLGVYGVVKGAESLHGLNLKGGLRSFSRTGLIMLGTALAAKAIGSLAIDGFESSFKGGSIGKNLFRETLMTQVSHGNLIRLLPLVKDGKPLVAGGYEYIQQKDRFKEVFGSFFNPIKDSIDGFRQNLIQLEEDAELLGVRQYRGLVSVKAGISTVGEYVTNGAIPEEVFLYKFIEEK
jgi:hypothetical protein